LVLPASYDERPLLAAADFVSQVSDDLHLLVLLGDLATTGISDDLLVAEQTFLDASVSKHLNAALEPKFGGLDVPLHVVPGNHDRYQDDFATPGSTEFDKVFRSVYAPTNGVCTKPIVDGGLTAKRNSLVLHIGLR
jgi:3',5'-cyclic AMP phosphodiesterase CpdA